MIEVKQLPNNYEHIAHVSLVEDIVVLAKVQTNFGIQYATWVSSDGENWYYGHYTFDYAEAMKDMFDRAERYAHVHRPSPYEAWMETEVEYRIKGWLSDNDMPEKLLEDSDFMYRADQYIRNCYEDNWQLGDRITDSITDAFIDVFGEEMLEFPECIGWQMPPLDENGQTPVTNAICPKCGKLLHESDDCEYKYVCYDCDENFLGIEVSNFKECE